MSERYCAAHVIVKQEHDAIRNKHYDKNLRNKSHDKFYHSKAWKIVREVVMMKHGGLCQKCYEKDMTVKADVVDHIIPLEKDYDSRLKYDNLQPLCHQCHNQKTQQDLKQQGGRV